MLVEQSDLKATLIAHYDAAAAERESKGLAGFRSPHRRAFADMLAAEGVGELVDLGAGTGHESLWFAERGFQVSATDLSPAHVELCRRKGIAATVADFYALPFEAGRFPAAWCMSSLMHIPNADVDLVLAGFARILTPGAPMALGFWGGDDTEGTWEQDYAKPRRFYSLRSEETMRKELGIHFDIEHFASFSVDGVSAWPYQYWIVRCPAGTQPNR